MARLQWVAVMLAWWSTCGVAAELYQVRQPVVLGAAAVRLPLDQASARGAGRLADGASGGALVLALSGIWADQAPRGGYRLYLNLPAGRLAEPDDPGYLGELSLYDVPGHYRPGQPKQVSFLLDEAIERLVRAGRMAQAPSLTLIPVRPRQSQPAVHIESISILSTTH